MQEDPILLMAQEANFQRPFKDHTKAFLDNASSDKILPRPRDIPSKNQQRQQHEYSQ
jgi:hypothetical protein